MKTTPYSQASPFVNPSPWSSTPSESTTSQSLAQNKTAQISFTTREGDQVTISTSQLRAAAMASRARSDGTGSTSSFTAAALKTDSFSMTVQGDLNEEELKDISHFMTNLTAIAGDFFNGDSEKAIAGATQLGELGSLSKLSAEFTSSTAISSRSQLRSNHPLPDLGKTSASDFGLPAFGADQDKLIKDAILGNWRQIDDFLNRLQPPAATMAKPTPEPAPQPATPNMGVASATAQTDPLQQLVRQASSFITNNPRLSPFLIPLASRAFDQASAQTDPAAKSPWRTPEQLLAELGNYLNS